MKVGLHIFLLCDADRRLQILKMHMSTYVMHVNDYLSPFMLPQLSPNRGHGGFAGGSLGERQDYTSHRSSVYCRMHTIHSHLGGGWGWGGVKVSARVFRLRRWKLEYLDKTHTQGTGRTCKQLIKRTCAWSCSANTDHTHHHRWDGSHNIHPTRL